MLGTLFNIVCWAMVISSFVGGSILCIVKLIKGNREEKAQAVIAVILGIVAFTGMYALLESVEFCLFATGIVLCLVAGASSDDAKRTSSEGKNMVLSMRL